MVQLIASCSLEISQIRDYVPVALGTRTSSGRPSVPQLQETAIWTWVPVMIPRNLWSGGANPKQAKRNRLTRQSWSWRSRINDGKFVLFSGQNTSSHFFVGGGGGHQSQFPVLWIDVFLRDSYWWPTDVSVCIVQWKQELFDWMLSCDDDVVILMMVCKYGSMLPILCEPVSGIVL